MRFGGLVFFADSTGRVFKLAPEPSSRPFALLGVPFALSKGHAADCLKGDLAARMQGRASKDKLDPVGGDFVSMCGSGERTVFVWSSPEVWLFPTKAEVGVSRRIVSPQFSAAHLKKRFSLLSALWNGIRFSCCSRPIMIPGAIPNSRANL